MRKRLHHNDRAAFAAFAATARALGRSPSDYHAHAQAEARDRFGGALDLAPHERRGIEFAARHIAPGQSCLVAGCGAGAEIAALRELGVANLRGLEISPVLAASCAQRFDIAAIAGDMAAPPLAARAVDVVLTHRSLHHMLHPYQALEALAACARHTLIVADEPVRSAIKRVRDLLRGDRLVGDDASWEYQFEPDMLIRHMGYAGFEPVDAIRYWETTRPGNDAVANALMGRLGNRLTFVFRRLPGLP